MICYFCYWGWPRQIYDIYKEAVRRLRGDNTALRYGPAHVVWEDENFGCAKQCLDDIETYDGDLLKYELEVVRWSLEQLDKVPDEIKNIADEYERAFEANEKINIKDYPPPKHLEMIKK